MWEKRAPEGERRESLLMLAPWPTHLRLQNAQADAEMEWVIKFVTEVRSVRAEMNVPAAAKSRWSLSAPPARPGPGRRARGDSQAARPHRDHRLRRRAARGLGPDCLGRGDAGAAAPRRHRYRRGIGAFEARDR
ncbi:class I tRNA ligase family protein [Methyloceanibacter marginalis]|uniref:class I tRNA ligase family protein n=1 Tax=Methyloceanibacter marginalis TaxID=1774971 RepID=UPI003CC7AE2E